MDRLTTGDGTGASILRCDSVPGDCPMPSIQCQDFTPPGYYYIRRAIAELYLAFETAQQQLVAETIVEGLGIAQMVQDFGVKTIKQQESLCASQIAKDTQGGKLHIILVAGTCLLTQKEAIGIAGGLISAVKDSLPAGPKLAAGIISGLATSIGAALGVYSSSNLKTAPYILRTDKIPTSLQEAIYQAAAQSALIKAQS